jgi:hypothetical protein
MTFNQNVNRIGFACKFAEINKKGEIASVEGMNTGGTTMAWANRQSRRVAEEKIDRKSTRLNSSHNTRDNTSRMPSSA